MDDPMYHTWGHDRLAEEATRLRNSLEQSISAFENIHSRAVRLHEEIESYKNIIIGIHDILNKLDCCLNNNHNKSDAGDVSS
jgi:uncharacterized coiled-coil DUF342 family protein